MKVNMLFLRFFFSPCQDVFKGVKLPVCLSCQLVLGQETYGLACAMETESQNEPDMPFLRAESNRLFNILKAIFMPFECQGGFL
jgi:hypothetical protein